MAENKIWEEKISFFIELGKPLSRAKTIKETLSAVMYQVGKIFQPVNWSLFLKEKGSDNLIFSLVVGKNKEKLQGRRLPKGEGIAGHIFTTRDPLIVSDVGNDDRFSHRVDQFTGFKTQSIIGVPLKSGKNVFGVIELINKVGGEKFTPVDLKILSSIAEYAAIAIERSYAYQSLQKMALYDSLTGLKNKNHFTHTLTRQAHLIFPPAPAATLMFINIRRFQSIIEAKGRRIGDRVARNLAQILKESAPDADNIFRYDADEFIILMPDTPVYRAEETKNRIEDMYQEYLENEKGEFTFRINIELISIDAKTARELVEMVHNRVHEPADITGQAYSEPMEDNIQVMLEEEDRSGTGKNNGFHGRTVNFSGTFVLPARKEHGDLLIKGLSSKGISFEANQKHAIGKEDLLNIVFRLDDQKRSQIKRQIIVQAVDGGCYEATFYNPPPYDPTLGFYLMS